MARLFQLLETVAPTSSTILITGETGTGKEVVARAIHHNSPRRAHRFVALNCSAIPETLLEAELFGHVRGAFTGAVGNRQGRLEQAHKGTLFLDEVGTMSAGAADEAAARAAGARVRARRRLAHDQGGRARASPRPTATSRQMVADGTFREDLFYRLNVIPVQLPPLRERKEDIPLLVQHFLEKFCARRCAARDADDVSQEAMRRLMAYAWPGNVRQLENAVERALALSGGAHPDRRGRSAAGDSGGAREPASSVVDLPEDGLDLGASSPRIERELIDRALERTGGNKGRRRAAAQPEAHDARREAEAAARADRRSIRSRHAAAIRLLDDHRRRPADRVSRRGARRTAADAEAAAGQAARPRR